VAAGVHPTSGLPTSPPACPVSRLTADPAYPSAAPPANATRACACARCPGASTSRGGAYVELSQCRPPSAGSAAAAQRTSGAQGPCGSYVVGVRAHYDAARGMLAGLALDLSDGSTRSIGAAASTQLCERARRGLFGDRA
jgi:hypothetical protein